MLHDTQVALTRRIFAHLDAGTTDRADGIASNAVDAFTSTDRLRREWEILFLNHPQYLGLSCQLRQPGDFFTHDDLGVPILVTRDTGGQVRAFLNVCRHRGARLADGCGKRRRFVCPYHAWSYDGAGRLTSVPENKSFGAVDKAAFGLTELPVEVRCGMIYVAARPDAPLNLDPIFSGLEGELANYNFADQHHYETRARVWKMNWKIAVDTFLEPYHFPALHRDTVAPIFFPNLCLVDQFGPNIREVLVRRSIADMRARPEDDWDLVPESALVYILAPNTVVIVQIDHYEIWRFYPVGGKVDETRIYLDFYIPEEAKTARARDHWQKNLDLTMRTVELEDFPTGEGIQAGMGSGAQDRVVYGRNEPALQMFERIIAGMIGADSFYASGMSGAPPGQIRTKPNQIETG